MSTVGSGTANLPYSTSPAASVYGCSAHNVSLTLADESLTLVALLEGWEYGRHRLGSILLVQLRTSRDGVLATTYLEAEEYGWGRTEEEAILDLMTSLGEYLESLEAREGQLAEPTFVDLERLHQLFRPLST